MVDADLRSDLNLLADAALSMLDQVDALPHALAYGDACPQNLLRGVDRSAFTALPLELLDVELAPDVVRLLDRRARFARVPR